MPLLALFTVFALLDFVILFSVGSQIGLLTTLALVLATGFVGLHLIRREGVATMARAQQRFAQGELPSSELLTGAALIFGGALLMAPGFLSDALGLMCLLPNARRLLGKLLARIGVRWTSLHRRPHPGADGWDEASARPQDRHAGEQADSQDETGERPLEGDFIAKDEPRR